MFGNTIVCLLSNAKVITSTSKAKFALQNSITVEHRGIPKPCTVWPDGLSCPLPSLLQAHYIAANTTTLPEGARFLRNKTIIQPMTQTITSHHKWDFRGHQRKALESQLNVALRQGCENCFDVFPKIEMWKCNGASRARFLPAPELQVWDRDAAQSGAQHHEEDREKKRGSQACNTRDSDKIVTWYRVREQVKENKKKSHSVGVQWNCQKHFIY